MLTDDLIDQLFDQIVRTPRSVTELLLAPFQQIDDDTLVELFGSIKKLLVAGEPAW